LLDWWISFFFLISQPSSFRQTIQSANLSKDSDAKLKGLRWQPVAQHGSFLPSFMAVNEEILSLSGGHIGQGETI
jgi:hypothetical protein